MSVLIIGCGLMGRGIAFVTAANAQHPVVLVDASQQVIDDAIIYIKRIIKRNNLDEAKILANISVSKSIKEALTDKNITFVIEAVPEKLELKRIILTEIVKYASPNTVVATNTSSLPITMLAESVDDHARPRVIGMHFFNPVPRIAGLEVIPSKYTAEEIVNKTVRLGKAMGKNVSVCKLDIAGFIVNRIINASLLEALSLLEKEAGTPEDIDRVMKSAAGHPIGPFKLTDMIGLDTAAAISNVIYTESGNDPRYRPSPVLEKMIRQGKLGMKTGEGFYRYNKL